MTMASILPMRSLVPEKPYKWDGKIINDKEFLLRLLSKTSFFQEIKEIIQKNHSYDVPEIISFEVNNSSTDYKKWALNI